MNSVSSPNGPTKPRAQTKQRRRFRGERGSAATEVVILVPMAVLMVGFVITVGRLSSTNQDVHSASRDAARAAAVRQYPAAAQADANQAATTTLTARGVSCRNLTINVDTSQMQPGGQVTATVTCEIGLDDVVGLGIPGSKTVTATSVAVVDTYRGGQTP